MRFLGHATYDSIASPTKLISATSLVRVMMFIYDDNDDDDDDDDDDDESGDDVLCACIRVVHRRMNLALLCGLGDFLPLVLSCKPCDVSTNMGEWKFNRKLRVGKKQVGETPRLLKYVSQLVPFRKGSFSLRDKKLNVKTATLELN
ncbi:hypothetical protein MTR_7g056463 [Medicago truncatula]|uniref:Uncharacterized protein n=1 Tax=Medicago truncatula TaxID=3880 RepID=A0A072UA09_MEDTR|nr:hypothetical protein MTR_7g056463 [Medicago truncatula]